LARADVRSPTAKSLNASLKAPLRCTPFCDAALVAAAVRPRLPSGCGTADELCPRERFAEVKDADAAAITLSARLPADAVGIFTPRCCKLEASNECCCASPGEISRSTELALAIPRPRTGADPRCVRNAGDENILDSAGTCTGAEGFRVELESPWLGLHAAFSARPRASPPLALGAVFAAGARGTVPCRMLLWGAEVAAASGPRDRRSSEPWCCCSSCCCCCCRRGCTPCPSADGAAEVLRTDPPGTTPAKERMKSMPFMGLPGFSAWRGARSCAAAALAVAARGAMTTVFVPDLHSKSDSTRHGQ